MIRVCFHYFIEVFELMLTFDEPPLF